MVSRSSDDMNAERVRLRAELIGAMGRHHRRRRTLQRTLPVLGLAALATLVMVSVDLSRTETDLARVPTPVPTPAPDGDLTPRFQPTIITHVRTDPSILDRYRATATHRVEMVSDAELLASLAEVDRPTGMIREADTVRLTDDIFDPIEERTSRDG